ncbi:MAG TPA: hypothetical protein VK871_12995 [Candidatus Limnocylindrales bacterium]|nr:hypothetical protein [Candidatus Limnocylindrales bacterium]
MLRSIRLVGMLSLLAILAFATTAATAAGGPKVLDARLTGIPQAGLVLNGVTGGGVPWVIEAGRAKLFADGRLEVEVDGLVIAATGVNPVANGRAVLTCGDAPAASSPIVPFSPEGDAEVSTRVDLPDPCLAPAIFWVGVLNSGAQPWFAVTGV